MVEKSRHDSSRLFNTIGFVAARVVSARKVKYSSTPRVVNKCHAATRLISYEPPATSRRNILAVAFVAHLRHTPLRPATSSCNTKIKRTSIIAAAANLNQHT